MTWSLVLQLPPWSVVGAVGVSGEAKEVRGREDTTPLSFSFLEKSRILGAPPVSDFLLGRSSQTDFDLAP